MSDRLNELQHQRALLQENLAWLEREIAAEMERSGVTPEPSLRGQPAPVPPLWQSPIGSARSTSAGSASADVGDADAILQQYRDESKDLRQNVRRGCFVYFALALLLLGLAVTALYFHTTRR